MNFEQIPPKFGNGLADELELLFFEARALSNRLKQSVRSIHRDDLPMGALAILQSLEQDASLTVPQIARHRSTSRQNVQIIVNGLASAGFVEFVENPAHKRSDLLRLTARGAKLLADAVTREAAFLARLLPHIAEAQVLSAAKLLRKLRSVISAENLTQPGSTPVRSTRIRRRAKPSPVRRSQESAPVAQLPLDDSADESLPVNLL